MSAFIATDLQGLICGLGASPEAAIANANVNSGYPDGVMATTCEDISLEWVTHEATPALASAVRERGGDIGWTWIPGRRPRLACLQSEVEGSDP